MARYLTQSLRLSFLCIFLSVFYSFFLQRKNLRMVESPIDILPQDGDEDFPTPGPLVVSLGKTSLVITIKPLKKTQSLS